MNLENLKKPLVNVGHLVVDEQNFSTGVDDCIMCNREVKDSKYYIHACDGSIDYICSQDDDDYVTHNDPGDMGSWTVGSECVKKLQAHLVEEGVNPDDYIYTKPGTKAKSKSKSKAKAKTKPLYITEEESLILWKLLGREHSRCEEEFPHNDICKLYAKIIHKSCSFAGTLEEGETVNTIYKDLYERGL